MTPVLLITVRNRWRAWMIAVFVIGLWLLLAMAIYRDIDMSIYTNMPDAVRELMGIPDGADAATLAYGVMFDFVAPLVLASMAISMGAAAVAGEERDGTIALLLASPISRRGVLAAKLGAIVALTSAATLACWVFARLVPSVLDIELGASHLGAMAWHIAANALLYAMVAFFIGAWTGDRRTASSTAVALMVISYFAVALLGLVESISGFARIVPWYYFSSSRPLLHGASFGHLAVLGTSALVLAVAAFVVVDKRDLRQPTTASKRNWLPAGPSLEALADRFATGRPSSRIWTKAISEHRVLLVGTSALMFLVLGALMGPLYLAVESEIADLGNDLPASIMALAGNGDLSTPEGWFQIETFSLMAPSAVMLVTIAIGARGLTREESTRTLGLLLANPIRRSQFVLETALAMTVCAAVVGIATAAGVVVANMVSSLQMDSSSIMATSLLTTSTGLLFGAIALLFAAATGSARISTFGAIGLALSSYLANAFLPLSDRLAPWARLSPHHYMLASDPLRNGLDWSHALLLGLAILAVVRASVIQFERRDIRN